MDEREEFTNYGHYFGVGIALLVVGIILYYVGFTNDFYIVNIVKSVIMQFIGGVTSILGILCILAGTRTKEGKKVKSE